MAKKNKRFMKCPPLKITVLGCGPSGGVPMIGCHCDVCLSDNPKNKRLRASILVESATTRILVDFGPDIRQQALRHHIDYIDAALLTHAHADHFHGIDDIRYLYRDAELPVVIHGGREHLNEVSTRFSYTFKRAGNRIRPELIASPLDEGDEVMIGDIPVRPFRAPHGGMDVLGFRFGKFAYLTDCHDMPKVAQDIVRGAEVFLVEAYQLERFETRRPIHATIDQTLDWIKKTGVKQAYLTDMYHYVDYDRIQEYLPKNVKPSYDGMVIKVA